jgi:hypothetical protein
MRKRCAAHRVAEGLIGSGSEHIQDRQRSEKFLKELHSRLALIERHIKVLETERREVLKLMIKEVSD